MKKMLLLPALLLTAVVSMGAAIPSLPSPTISPISGDYVEARTASVFAGACHYNGELVTIGTDAVMAWKFTSGTWNRTDLSGLRAMAAVSSPDNLKNEDAPRKCEIVVDTAATPAQVSAFTDLLKVQYHTQMGQIIDVRRGPVLFTHTDAGYVVNADGFASLNVQSLPDHDCCKQPSLVWYTPLFNLDHRMVGYTQSAAYSAGRIGDIWSRGDENSAFYGAFTIQDSQLASR